MRFQSEPRTIADQPVDLVIYDMAPNMCGVRSADLSQAMFQSGLALDFAGLVLVFAGDFLIKTFQIEDFYE